MGFFFFFGKIYFQVIWEKNPFLIFFGFSIFWVPKNQEFGQKAENHPYIKSLSPLSLCCRSTIPSIPLTPKAPYHTYRCDKDFQIYFLRKKKILVSEFFFFYIFLFFLYVWKKKKRFFFFFCVVSLLLGPSENHFQYKHTCAGEECRHLGGPNSTKKQH